MSDQLARINSIRKDALDAYALKADVEISLINARHDLDRVISKKEYLYKKTAQKIDYFAECEKMFCGQDEAVPDAIKNSSRAIKEAIRNPQADLTFVINNCHRSVLRSQKMRHLLDQKNDAAAKDVVSSLQEIESLERDEGEIKKRVDLLENEHLDAVRIFNGFNDLFGRSIK